MFASNLHVPPLEWKNFELVKIDACRNDVGFLICLLLLYLYLCSDIDCFLLGTIFIASTLPLLTTTICPASNCHLRVFLTGNLRYIYKLLKLNIYRLFGVPPRPIILEGKSELIV